MAAISTTDSTATVVKEMNDSDSAPFEVAKSLGFIPYPSQPKRTRFMAQLLFRVLAIAFTVASISVMVTSDQTILIFGITTQARYSYSSAFRFLVGAEAVVCGFSVLSLSLLCLMSRSEAILRKNFYLFLHDMAMMVVMVSGCAAATAIGYVGRYGEKEITWAAVCDYIDKFCNQTLVSIVLAYLAFFCYLALTTLSAHQLMSTNE
ncbi:CASP-like protein 1F2 isoform X2 [Mercurialis annua]|uniref:CASP-like protein 1F2 isoform X2 n=1 Tax=Mercurialis annua TaxID=3986 RepID=UPI00215E2779|nr:CASP-like protein 1F2 isoform X2 [Mercurialis annua]